MDERCADEFVANGDLTPDWRPSFLAVPRQRFIPDVIWHEVDDVVRPVRRADDPDRWLELASGKDSMVTQVDDGAPVGPGDSGELSDAGFGGVTTITGDGSLGYPPAAPYDRMIATVGSTYVPYAWVGQTRPGGRIVVPSWALSYYGLLLALTVREDGTATGHFVDDASFMMLRDQRAHRSRQVISDTDEDEQATITETELHPADVASGRYSRGAVIAIGTRVPDCRSDYFPSREPGSNDGTLRLADHLSGSWARLRYDHNGGPPYPVCQFGPRRLWDEVHAAYQWWVDHGSPTAERWRFTVTPRGQRVELVDDGLVPELLPG